MRVLSFSGTPREIGRAFGETCRDDIRALYDARVRNVVDNAKLWAGRSVGEADILRVADRSLPIVRAYHESGYQELEGIAEGSDLSLAKIWAMNALTDLRDVLAFGDPEAEGCTASIVQGDITESGNGLLSQTWDLATDNMPFVLVVKRQVKGGPSTASMTLVGCLSLIGMNEHGIAIGTTNINSKDSRPGVGYLDVIHKVLALKELESGAKAVIDATRAGAHYYFAMDARGAAWSIECTAKLADRTDVPSGSYVHTNHILTEQFLPIEAGLPYPSSRCRITRMQSLLSTKTDVTVDDLKRWLADHDGDTLSICRHDFNGITSDGAIIMEPATRKLWAVHGPPCQGTWIEVTV